MKVAQSCPTLCNPMDYTVHGLLQARILEWVAFPFSRGSSQPRDQTQVFLYQLSPLQGKPKNTGVDNLSLLQQIFPTQESPALQADSLPTELSVQFSRSVISNSVTPWTAARQASLSITNSRRLLILTSIESVIPSNHLILRCPLLLLPSIFPSIS